MDGSNLTSFILTFLISVIKCFSIGRNNHFAGNISLKMGIIPTQELKPLYNVGNL